MTHRQGNGEAAVSIMDPLCAVFRRRLKQEGLKYTPERAQILDAIVGIDDLFKVDRLQETLRKGGFRVSKATVYRTIRLLQEAGIIQQVLFDADQAHYQLAWGRRPRDLIVRVDSGEVLVIEAPGLTEMCERLCRERGLTMRGRRLQVFATGPAGADQGDGAAALARPTPAKPAR